MKAANWTFKALLIIVFLCLAGLASAAGKKTALREPLMTPLVPHGLIREAGWTYNWQSNLPVKTDETVDRIFLFDPYVFVLTDQNILFCLERRSGRMLSTALLSERDLPLCSPIYYEGLLGFIAGNQIRVFDPATGQVEQAEAMSQVGNIYECAFSQNDQFIYIAGSGKRLHAISPDGYWQAFTATADNDSAINSVIATDSVVVFSTEAGNVVGMDPTGPKKQWQYDISGPIRARMVADETHVYVTGMDAKVYKLEIETGKPAWDVPYHTGAPLRAPALIGETVVYVYNHLNGLYAVRQDTGQAVWNLPAGKGTLCESEGKAFVFTSPGVLTVMDNNTGQSLYSVNFNQVRRYAENMTDAVLYVADEAGRLMSITVE